MKYDFFISSRYRNKEIVLELAQKIRAQNKSVYAFVESEASIKHVGEVSADAEESIKKFEQISDWHTSYKVKEVFETDMEALKNSETVILLLPAGKSSHIEAGAAYGFGKRMILIGEQKETESLYLIFSEFYNTIDDFISTI